MLLLAGIVIGLFGLLWALTQPGSGGGRIFAAMFFVLIALPLLAGGAYLFMRGKQEEQFEQGVTQRRRTLESETLSRAQIADRIFDQRDRLQAVLASASASANPTSRLLLEDAMNRLNSIGNVLRRPSYERAGSFEALAADSSDPDTVRSIDATLDSGVRTLEQQVTDLVHSLGTSQPSGPLINRLTGTISRMENATNERTRVLTSGEQKALPTPAELLRGIQPTGTHEPGQFGELKPNDALTYEGEDYVVSGRLEWSEGATRWHSYLLGGGSGELWLFAEQGGTRLAIMRPVAVPPDAGAEYVSIDGVRYALTRQGTATVSVTGSTGSRGGLFVGYRRYDGPEGRFLWLEEWDEGPKAMLANQERAESFDLWIR